MSDMVSISETNKESLNVAIVKELLNDENLDTKTEIKEEETINISIAETIADMFGIEEITTLIQKIKINRISENRKSRTEVIQAVNNMNEDKKTDDNILNKLMVK